MGVPRVMAEGHLEIAGQIIKTLQAVSFTSARAVLSPSAVAPDPLVIQPFAWLTILGQGPKC